MKLGLSMYSYVAAYQSGRLDIAGFIQESKRLGVEGVELLDFFWRDPATELPEVQAALKDTGLPVGVYSVANNFVSADEAVRAESVKKITDGVDYALLFGAKVVRVFAGDIAPEFTYEQCLLWIIAGLKEASEYAYTKGITLALENHGRLAGRSEQVQTILNAVGSPALKANPDTGNFLLVHQASHLEVAALATRAAMVHFKDFQVVSDNYTGVAYVGTEGLKFAGTAIGEGEVDLPDCVSALQQAGFDGWLNIEYEGSEDPFSAVSRSVDYTRRLLAQVI
ncbi:MAG: sugar phosphate isomerase/epimerase family protein [Janthinobacterium lividum]